MRMAEQGQKDLVILVADRHQERTVSTLLTRRPQSLGIQQMSIDLDILRHPEHDPGVFHKAGDFLSIFARRYQHALVLIDAEWGGLSAEKIEEKIQDDLNENGWEGRSAVIVIDPELEIWVWSTSPHVPRLLGTNWETIKDLGDQTGYWQEGETKPSRPKELLEVVLHRTRKPRSGTLYRQLAEKVGLSRCQDDSFRRFREVLQGWFPA